MNLKLGIGIHNKFEVEVRDAFTGELKQEAIAHNIILNAMYNQLVTLGSYFTYIHFGIGTGLVTPSDTTLFGTLGYKNAVDDTLIKAIPVSSWKRKIVLNPEEYVGMTLTEVGISNATSGILTHALLKDSEGNPISITKTSTDVVTIYATVYVTFSTQDETKIKFAGMPNNNQLVNWLIGGGAFYAQTYYFGENDAPPTNSDYAVKTYNPTGSSSAVTVANWIKDVAWRRVTTPAMRFATTVGNGHITEIGFGNSQTSNIIFRSVMPIAGVFTGQPYTGVPVGTGDGITKDFVLPSKNINQNSIVAKVDGTSTAITKTLISTAINFTMSNPSPAGSNIYSCAISQNGLILAATSNNLPYILTYDWNGGAWIKRPDPATIPTAVAKGCALSSDGAILAVAANNSPYIYTYDWNGSSWIKRPDPATIPTALSNGCALSSNGSTLAVSSALTPYILTYDWNGSAWIKRTNPATIPTATSNGCALLSDGSLLAVSSSNSPYIFTYDWNGGAWIKRPDPATLPTAFSNGCALSSDGSILAVVSNNSPYILTYDWNGSAWIKRANPATIPANTGYGCALSSDGSTLAVSSASTPYIYVYDWNGSAWIKRANPATIPNNMAFCCAISADNSFMVGGTADLPYLYFFDIKKRETKITFNTAPAVGAAITADYTVNGIHKTDQYVVDVSFSLQFGEVV